MEYWDEKSLEYKYQMTQVFEKLPEFIQKIVEKLFNNNVLSLFSFKHDYDPEERKANQEFVRKHNLFNKRCQGKFYSTSIFVFYIYSL